MTLNEYQEQAMTTCMESCDNFSYMMLNLVGEVGEFASKVAKSIRKEESKIGFSGIPAGENELVHLKSVSLEIDHELKSEAGDILWQLAGLCKVMGWDLEDVARMNLDKLAARKASDTIVTHQDH